MKDLENLLNTLIKSDKFNDFMLNVKDHPKMYLGNDVYIEFEKGRRNAFGDGLISKCGKIRESDRAIRLIDDKYRITISEFGEIYGKSVFMYFFQPLAIQKLMKSDNKELIKEFIQDFRPEDTIKEVYSSSKKVESESLPANFSIRYDWISNNPIRESYRPSKSHKINLDKWKNNEYKKESLDHFSKKIDLSRLSYFINDQPKLWRK